LATGGEIQFSDLLAALSVGLRCLSSGNMETGSGKKALLQPGVTKFEIRSTEKIPDTWIIILE
jgi:hypothetical protein